MAPAHQWPVPITTLGLAKGGTAVFRQAGKLHVTCVLKATFFLAAGAPMKQTEAENLFCTQAHHHDDPSRSIRAPSEVVPYLPRVDVVLTGHACAPTGKPINRHPVRLAVFHGIALLDKTLHVYGDREGGEIVPFERMPLTYERALGGPDYRKNPHGTGKSPGSVPPNIVYPKDGGVVAGFGPLPQSTRKSKMTAILDKSIAEFPADFDFSYFQSAPADQQLPSLVGNEWIVIEGVHPKHARITSRLPSVRPIATLFGIDPDDPENARAIQLRLDMVRIDADALRCSIISRGIVQLDDERALSTLRIAGAVETEEVRFAHLLTPPPAKAKTPSPATTLRIEAKSPKTLTLEDSARDPSLSATLPPNSRRKKPVMPFAKGAGPSASTSAAQPIPGAPWSAEPGTKPLPVESARTLGITLDLYPVDLSEPATIPPPPPEPEFAP